jgi:hypothetical protein
MDAGSIHVVPGAALRGRPRELEEVPMSIVGGLDIHRKQITFDYADTETGEVRSRQGVRVGARDQRVHPAGHLHPAGPAEKTVQYRKWSFPR